MLIEIKSRLLLPKPPPAPPGQEAEDPRAELVRRLLEYERMKQAARGLDEHPLAQRDYAMVRVWFDHVATARMPDVRPDDLKAAWAGLVARAKVNRHHLVTRRQLSVRSEMSRVLKSLERGRYTDFTALFAEHADVPHLVVTFLALLELAREELITIAQTEPYAPIHVTLTGTPEFQLAPTLPTRSHERTRFEPARARRHGTGRRQGGRRARCLSRRGRRALPVRNRWRSSVGR